MSFKTCIQTSNYPLDVSLIFSSRFTLPQANTMLTSITIDLLACLELETKESYRRYSVVSESFHIA